MGKGKPERAKALAFLRRVRRDADDLAEALDPRRGRDYADPVLKALDGIAATAARALETEGVAP